MQMPARELCLSHAWHRRKLMMDLGQRDLVAGHVSGSVAVLVAPKELETLVCDIIRDQDWLCEIITKDVLEQAADAAWSLVILSSSEGAEGLAILSAKASRNHGTRVLAISSERDPQHIADVLRSGADDYLVPPIDPSELAARMQALIGRSFNAPERRRNELQFDFSFRRISSGLMSVSLSSREWDVLMTLLEADGHSMTAEEISWQVWGDGSHGAAVVSTVSRIRHRCNLEEFRAIILRTDRGAGYSASFRRSSDAVPNLQRRAQ